jgi:hypothetical protein
MGVANAGPEAKAIAIHPRQGTDCTDTSADIPCSGDVVVIDGEMCPR